jgi:hypothetical protein
LKLKGSRDEFVRAWKALTAIAREIELPVTGVELFSADRIEEKKVKWLWRFRIPLGKLTLFAGQPGLGKSFATLDAAARLSTQRGWPDRAPAYGEIIDSVIFSAEDAMADTMIALGADRSRISIAKRMREVNPSGEITRRGFNLACDIPQLERALDARPDARLVVVDPISAYMSKVDTHRNAEVRSDVLEPLAELAERREIAVIAVTHLNKGVGGNGLDRVSGSVAFPAAARAVWGFSRDPDDPGKLHAPGEGKQRPAQHPRTRLSHRRGRERARRPAMDRRRSARKSPAVHAPRTGSRAGNGSGTETRARHRVSAQAPRFRPSQNQGT